VGVEVVLAMKVGVLCVVEVLYGLVLYLHSCCALGPAVRLLLK